MGRSSRTKGAVGERELAAFIRSFGFACERTGRNGRTSEDVTHDVPGLHIEGKRARVRATERWVAQAEADAPDGLVPAVFYRLDRDRWRVDMLASELLRLKQIERDVLAAFPERKAA